MVNVTIFLAYDWILWDMEEFLTVETWNIMDMADMYGFIVLFSSVNACFFLCFPALVTLDIRQQKLEQLTVARI